MTPSVILRMPPSSRRKVILAFFTEEVSCIKFLSNNKSGSRSGAVRRRTAGRRRIWFAPKGRSKGPGAPVWAVPATAPRPHGLHSLSVMHCPCTSLGGHYPTPLAPPYPRTEKAQKKRQNRSPAFSVKL